MMKLLSFRYWTYSVLKILFLVVGLVFSFNYMIDPYGKQNFFCEEEFKPILNERAKKYHDIFYEQKIKNYDSLILGSSRVMKIVPSHFEQTKSFYNFGVHVANNAEKLFLIEEWLKVKKIKKVYFGIDYYNFHKNKRPLYVDYDKFKKDDYGNYLSMSTLKLSFKSLLNKMNNSPQTYFMEDGSLNYYEKDKLILENKYDFSLKTFIHMAQENIQDDMIKDQFIIEERVFEILEKVKLLSIKYNFELYVFITPMQSEGIKIIKKDEYLNSQIEYIDDKLVQIFGKVYSFHELNRYNDDSSNFYDLVHYREMIGDKILLSLSKNESDYAKILTKELQ